MLPKQYLKQVIVIALAIGVVAAPMAAARPMLDTQRPEVHVDRVQARSQALANHVPPGGRISTADPAGSAAVRLVTVTAPSDGFDWGDAAIGAAATAAVALMIVAGGVAIRQRNQPRGIVS